MKDKGVCDNCKYNVTRKNKDDQKWGCDYLCQEGHSRLLVERANGGYKTDSCCCKVEGKPRKQSFSYISGNEYFEQETIEEKRRDPRRYGMDYRTN